MYICISQTNKNNFDMDTKKIIAFTDSMTECECCGRKGLKGTFCVVVEGREMYFGSTCAFKKHGFPKEDTRKAVKVYEEKQRWLKKSGGRFDNREDYWRDWDATVGAEIEAWVAEDPR